MYKAVYEIAGNGEFLFGARVRTPKKDDETSDAHEERTWKERVNCTSDDRAIMPSACIAKSLSSAAQFLGRKIPGEGKKTYTRRFKSGCQPTTHIEFFHAADGKPVMREDLEGKWLFVPAQGQSGGGTRVDRKFPIMVDWIGRGELLVLDDKIDEKTLHDHFVAAGRYIGIGSMRVENGNTNGRFHLVKLECSEIE